MWWYQILLCPQSPISPPACLEFNMKTPPHQLENKCLFHWLCLCHCHCLEFIVKTACQHVNERHGELIFMDLVLVLIKAKLKSQVSRFLGKAPLLRYIKTLIELVSKIKTKFLHKCQEKCCIFNQTIYLFGHNNT